MSLSAFFNPVKCENKKVVISKRFVDENGKVVGSLCINYDITNLMKGQIAIEKFTSKNPSIKFSSSDI